ncbi:MAG: hypothetical protein NWF01_00115 [Candidatus Bathyarchaeota archaeon]|nr:hypothetical protein [Candidatus Bathyarchaeota archaeon]
MIKSSKALVILSFFVIAFSSISIITTPVIDEVLPPSTFFFAQHLSPFYWLSVALLLALLLLRLKISLSTKKQRLIDVFLIFSLVLIVYGTQSFVYEQPLYQDTYIHTSAALKIPLRGGHTPAPLSMMAASNEPGGYIFFSFFLQITGLDSLLFMRYYPLLISTIILLLLYVASFKLVNTRFAIIAPFCFTAFMSTRVFHVYPGNLTYVFLIIFIIFASDTIRVPEKETRPILLLLVGASTITYILATPLLLFISLLFLIPLKSYVRKRNIIFPVSILMIWGS